jgi:hypothetical protein
MALYEIVKKLTGEIEPAGDSSIDDKRYDNLCATIELVNKLLYDIQDVARSRISYEASVQRAGKKAQAFLDEIREG